MVFMEIPYVFEGGFNPDFAPGKEKFGGGIFPRRFHEVDDCYRAKFVLTENSVGMIGDEDFEIAHCMS
jgi:hypothetical protein